MLKVPSSQSSPAGAAGEETGGERLFAPPAPRRRNLTLTLSLRQARPEQRRRAQGRLCGNAGEGIL